jgi:hypothetical protein
LAIITTEVEAVCAVRFEQIYHIVKPWTTLPPNKPLELTPLHVERDRCDFDSWFRLDCFPDL